MCAVLGGYPETQHAAGNILAEAAQAGSDPLVLALCKYRLSETEVFERAAHFCGLAFSDAIPNVLGDGETAVRLDLLRDAATIRAHVFDREVVFVAPTFAQFLVLFAHLKRQPGSIAHMCIVPPRVLRQALLDRHSDELIDQARQNLARHWRHATAHLDLSRAYRIGFVTGLAGLVLGAALAPFWLQPVLLPVLVALLVAPAWFRIITLISRTDADHGANPDPIAVCDLPVYSVLIPLRDEAHMVPQIAAAVLALDYPGDKLDIKFVVEAASPETVAAVRNVLNVPHFDLIVVPDAAPYTKPKALNYALPFCRGEHLAVFDAEDIPAPGQLQRAARLFAHWPDVDCIQAELSIDNAEENWITALFAAEYGALFGLTMPTIAAWDLPLPLGGTSNHFRTAVLDRIGGWDAFNVTEDADIGVRLARIGAKARTMSMATAEEAPHTFHAWLKQRTRWMKGWMQTLLVHNRHPGAFLRDVGWRDFIAFQINVGGALLTPLLHTVFSIALVVRLATTGSIAADPTRFWDFVQVFTFLVGNVSAAVLALAGARRLGSVRVLLAQCLLPVYWAMIGLAVLRAGWELISRPHFWDKTAHGTTRLGRSRAGRPAGAATDTAPPSGSHEPIPLGRQLD